VVLLLLLYSLYRSWKVLEPGGGLVFEAHRLVYHSGGGPRKHSTPRRGQFFIDNLLVRTHYIIVMIKWTGLAPGGGPREHSTPHRGRGGTRSLRRPYRLRIDNLLVRIHYIIMMIKWTGLAPWEF